MSENYFIDLYAVDVSRYKESKNGLSYLSWSFAWAEIKKRHPAATYAIYENASGWNYHTDGRTAWVKTGLTIDGLEHIEMLPVMDNRNRSIPLESVTSFDVNKAIQRSLTKAAARHGLGLYIYAGEDLPEQIILCECCGKEVTAHGNRTAAQMAAASKKAFGKVVCIECGQKLKADAQQTVERGATDV